ncbi:hypothetical protein [Pseudomonas sp.]|uniref:hypothetical protein n=1 Tax=Pseudomonas sp. TaxID=306 RepID=UPI001D7FC3CC|nr:hypothetical protein [Pseudomonas sp.]MBS6036477.1 hypothetical protein [Pseudomonas sp.]
MSTLQLAGASVWAGGLLMDTGLLVLLVGTFLLAGCHTMSTGDPPLDEYDAAVKRGEPENLLQAAAIRDIKIAHDWCWSRSNNYEKRAKNSEYWKLGLGAGGGVLGMTGAMLVAAGTGGFAPGIASGVAGVVSTTLGNSQNGPLGTSEFIQERDGTAAEIMKFMNTLDLSGDSKALEAQAIKLTSVCRSEIVKTEKK